jgi:hypothetical protein
MQILGQLVSEKNIQTGGDSFSDKNSQDEFLQIDPERTGDIADKVGWQKGEKTPKYDYRQLIFRKGRFQSLDMIGIFLFEKSVKTQKFGKIIDAYG